MRIEAVSNPDFCGGGLQEHGGPLPRSHATLAGPTLQERLDATVTTGESSMTNQFKLDMTIMLAMHDAFRRDLGHVAQMTGRSDGWDLFERLLRRHHTAEDEALWPMLREAVAGRSDDVALVDEMETEHAALEPLLEAIDVALERGETAPEARVELASMLRDHLAHEEEDALPLIDATLTWEQWMHFGETATRMIGADGPSFWPWMLDGADAERAAAALGLLPEPVQDMYRSQWQPEYAAKDWWAM